LISEAEARARVREAGGVELLERLEHLDAHRWAPAPRLDPTAAPDPDASTDFDVVIVGGGLWSILAPVLAARGVRVAVFDRARVGVAHREWNASGPELRTLVDAGLVTDAELSALVVARYDHGTCRFHGGGSYPVFGVLDHAVEAGPLLGGARALAERRGVAVFDGHALEAHASGRRSVRLRFRTRDGAKREVLAKLMVDARGAASPHATADLVCPTVGGVMKGLVSGEAPDEVNPRVGEILATVDSIEDGRQHVWEAFPGRPGEVTVYLFYYARATTRDRERISLAKLYARFFATLPGYKRGEGTLERPTFGFIPGWSRLSPAPRAPDARVVLVGDAAARHSPLTYCGFGATLRSLVPAADALARALAGEPSHLASHLERVVDDAPVHALTGALAHMLASRAFGHQDMNSLMDAAFRTLHEMGDEHYAQLLRDEMKPAAFVDFLRRTASRHPAVWGKITRGLGFKFVGRWSLGLARSMVASA
jgi:lycopene cyclase CruA